MWVMELVHLAENASTFLLQRVQQSREKKKNRFIRTYSLIKHYRLILLIDSYSGAAFNISFHQRPCVSLATLSHTENLTLPSLNQESTLPCTAQSHF